MPSRQSSRTSTVYSDADDLLDAMDRAVEAFVLSSSASSAGLRRSDRLKAKYATAILFQNPYAMENLSSNSELSEDTILSVLDRCSSCGSRRSHVNLELLRQSPNIFESAPTDALVRSVSPTNQPVETGLTRFKNQRQTETSTQSRKKCKNGYKLHLTQRKKAKKPKIKKFSPTIATAITNRTQVAGQAHTAYNALTYLKLTNDKVIETNAKRTVRNIPPKRKTPTKRLNLVRSIVASKRAMTNAKLSYSGTARKRSYKRRNAANTKRKVARKLQKNRKSQKMHTTRKVRKAKPRNTLNNYVAPRGCNCGFHARQPQININVASIRKRPQIERYYNQDAFQPVQTVASILPARYPNHFTAQLPPVVENVAPPPAEKPQQLEYDFSLPSPVAMEQTEQSLVLNSSPTIASLPSLTQSIYSISDSSGMHDEINLNPYKYQLTAQHVKALALGLNLKQSFLCHMIESVQKLHTTELEKVESSLDEMCMQQWWSDNKKILISPRFLDTGEPETSSPKSDGSVIPNSQSPVHQPHFPRQRENPN